MGTQGFWSGPAGSHWEKGKKKSESNRMLGPNIQTDVRFLDIMRVDFLKFFQNIKQKIRLKLF